MNIRRVSWALVPLFFALLCAGSVSRAQESFPDGSLWRAAGDSRTYVISVGRKRLIPNDAVFASYGWKADAVQSADPDILFSIPDVRVIQVAGETAMWDIVTGKRYLFRSADEFITDGFTWGEVAIVNRTELESYAVDIATDMVTTTRPTVTPTPSASSTAPTVTPTPVPESALVRKITEARTFLAAKPPVYLQETVRQTVATLSTGATGPEVEALQAKLQALGFFPKATEVNGNFGAATKKAVQAFQRSRKLSQTGSVGAQTLAALKKASLVLPVSGTRVSQWRGTVPQDREVLLGAWNAVADELQAIQVTLVSKAVKVGRSLRSVYSVVTKTPGFTVRYRGGNGVNVQYAVTSPAGWQVLANRFPIFDAASGRLGTFPPREEVYVPYSADFLTPDIVDAGSAYLNAAVTEALARLRAHGVQSASGRGLIADLTDPDELKAIAIIEHVDHAEFQQSEDKRGVVNKVFAVLGTNRETAYRFSGSSKGALGLAQFIRSTYRIIVSQHPEAGLLPDFEAGMNDHVNALEAMALYHDVTGATLEDLAAQKLGLAGDDLAYVLAEVRAAAYNGGAGRVKLALTKYGQKWDTTASATRYSLRTETRVYLQKFRVVRDILKNS